MADVLLRGQMGSTLATSAWANRLDFGYFFAGRRGSMLPTFTHVASTQMMVLKVTCMQAASSWRSEEAGRTNCCCYCADAVVVDYVGLTKLWSAVHAVAGVQNKPMIRNRYNIA